MLLSCLRLKFEAQLTSIECNIDIFEQGQQELSKTINHLDVQIAQVEKKESRLEKMFELLEDDFKYMGDEARGVQMVVEGTIFGLKD